MAEYLQPVLRLKSKIPRYDFKWVPRSKNNHTNSLANPEVAKEFQFRRKIPIKHIANSSVQQPTREVLCLNTSPGWRDPIITYLKYETLFDDKTEAQKVQHLATRNTLLKDTQYKKSYSRLHSDPYLRCLRLDEHRKVMQKIHDGDYGNHARGHFLAHKVINHGYYKPKMFDDAKDYVKKCL